VLERAPVLAKVPASDQVVAYTPSRGGVDKPAQQAVKQPVVVRAPVQGRAPQSMQPVVVTGPSRGPQVSTTSRTPTYETSRPYTNAVPSRTPATSTQDDKFGGSKPMRQDVVGRQPATPSTSGQTQGATPATAGKTQARVPQKGAERFSKK
jgi:hypothetical protein